LLEIVKVRFREPHPGTLSATANIDVAQFAVVDKTGQMIGGNAEQCGGLTRRK
jgi:hypothetical protein